MKRITFIILLQWHLSLDGTYSTRQQVKTLSFPLWEDDKNGRGKVMLGVMLCWETFSLLHHLSKHCCRPSTPCNESSQEWLEKHKFTVLTLTPNSTDLNPNQGSVGYTGPKKIQYIEALLPVHKSSKLGGHTFRGFVVSSPWQRGNLHNIRWL